MTKRLKTPALPVPRTREEFEAAAVQLAGTMREISLVNANAAGRIAQVKLDAKLAAEALGRHEEALFGLAEAMPTHRLESVWMRFRQPLAAFPWPLFLAEGAAIDAGQFSQLLDLVRIIGSNVDCVDGPVWLRPGNLITAEMARQLVVLAETLVRHPPEQRTMRLWLTVVTDSSQGAPDEEILGRFKEGLETEGLGHAAAMIDRYRMRLMLTEQAA